jgi:sialic acid synthase
MAKKLVAAKDLPAGHVLTDKDIAVKAPNDGLPPYEFDNVVGMRLTAPLNCDENIEFKILEKLAGTSSAQASSGGAS